MTTVWRICRRPFADLSGEGARLNGGRWNAPGRPLIYAAETAALAVLEVRVHLDLDWDMLPEDYVLVAIDTAAIVAETIHEFPDDPRAVGDAWIESRRSALLRVPSWIVPESYNVLINPAHPDAPSIKLGPIRPYQFDRRLCAVSDSRTGRSRRALGRRLGCGLRLCVACNSHRQKNTTQQRTLLHAVSLSH